MLLAMAMPHDLLIGSCGGGLFPFKLDPRFIVRDPTLQPWLIRNKTLDGVGE
jgi:hypothetical protein